MFDVALYEPEIPQNTGNIIRLCANTGARLHLIEPLGFRLTDRGLRRAGLDYHEYAQVTQHASYAAFRATRGSANIFAFSTHGTRSVFDVRFNPADALLFGPETRGLPASILDDLGPDRVLRIPMMANSRSMNLANAVAVALYEAWRQCGCQTTG